MNQQRLHELVHYDPSTGLFTHLQTRGPVHAGTSAGCRNSAGYIRIKLDGRIYSAHRLAWLYVHGTMPPDDTDHINGVRDDNRIANLRLATRAQNSENRRKAHRNNQTGLQGVSANNGRYYAEITTRGKRVSLGRFSTPEEAHSAYLEAKARLHTFAPREAA